VPASHHLWLFVMAALALLATPGPAAVFVVTRSVQHGRSAGLMSTAGLGCGGVVHVVAAVLGLSAILASSAVAFNLIKLAGAAYLIFLGFKSLHASNSSQWVDQLTPDVSMHRQFLDGLIVNVLNPKPAIFFLAFLPQFVDPTRGHIRVQLAALGLLLVGMAFVRNGIYALAAASGRTWLLRNKTLLRYERYVSAAVYFGLGASAALTGHRAH